MGISVYATATIPPRGLLRRRPGRDQLFGDIAAAVRGAVRDPLLARFVDIGAHEHALMATLHPAGEPLAFEWSPDGTLSASAKTSTAGPGFHALCVDVLDAVGQQCGLRWQWADESESDYGVTRDFAKLQAEMRDFLRGLARSVIGEDMRDYVDLAINWPVDVPTSHGAGFTVTPTGPYARAWWESVANERDPAKLSAYAEMFYPWWRREPDASFWRQLGMVLLWSQVPWHPPATDAERNTMELALACFDRGARAQPDIDLPSRELGELRALLKQQPQNATPPRSEGVGFYRRMMSFRATGAWSVHLPGYFYPMDGEDPGTAVFWHGTRTVRISSFELGGKDARPAPAAQILATYRKDTPITGDVIDFAELHRVGWATVGPVTSDDGSPTLQLQGAMAVPGSLCIATIVFTDLADRAWAEATFRSLIAPPPDGAEGG